MLGFEKLWRTVDNGDTFFANKFLNLLKIFRVRDLILSFNRASDNEEIPLPFSRQLSYLFIVKTQVCVWEKIFSAARPTFFTGVKEYPRFVCCYFGCFKLRLRCQPFSGPNDHVIVFAK